MGSEFSQSPGPASQPAARTRPAVAVRRNRPAPVPRQLAAGPALRFEAIPIWPADRKTESRPATLANAAPPIVHEVLRHPGQPLDAQTRVSFEPRFGFDFSRVRVHADTQAARSACAVDAAAYTVGRHIVFGAGQFAPRSPSGRDLLRHELMHVEQQRSAVPPGVLAVAGIHSPLEQDAGRVAPDFILQRQPKQPPKDQPALPASLSQYPEDERKKIRRFDELIVEIADKVEEMFDPDRVPSYRTDADTQIVFADNIAGKDRHALDSLANYLVGVAPRKLGLNETAAVPVAPMKQVVRFTFFEHGKAKKVILIEAVRPLQTPASQEGEAKFKAKKCKFGAGWSQANKDLLYQALTLTPDSALRDGLTFARDAKPKDPDKATEAGIYQKETNTITMFDRAFTTTLPTRIYDSLVHEIGHAADLGGATLSGGDLKPGDFGPEFRKAAQKDGIAPDTSKPPRKTRVGTEATLKGSPTDQGDTNWKELFADTFSMFVTDPGLLQAIRPHIFDYFVQKFPAQAPAKAAPAKAPAPKP